jgi:HK/GC/Chemotaxis protein-like, sensor domain/Cache domain
MKIDRMILLSTVLAMSVTAAEGNPAVHDQGGMRTAELRSLLSCFAALGEGHIEHVLRDLKLIAMTKEVQGGNWEDMKPLLTEFRNSGTMAAAVWFVRPDGAYYTVEKGLTGLNLQDRPYFPKLLAGEDVAGDLVISKSTKKRSAIIAVPVKTNGKIIGALGASLSVEKISAMLDREMALPANMFFYALDSSGQTSLHRNAAFLFAYPSDMGSKSLAEKVGEMLAKPEGMVTYDFYGERAVVFKKFPLTGWVFAIGVVTGGPGQTRAELPPVLAELQKKITAELDKMDREVARLAGKLSEKDFKTAQTRKMLGDLCRSFPYAVDCAVVDRTGRMVLVEPEAFREFEGSDIGAQEQVARLQSTKRPWRYTHLPVARAAAPLDTPPGS